MNVICSFNDELYHHGIKGMRWGIRRFQNEDGSLTNAGRKRYADPNEGGGQESKGRSSHQSNQVSKSKHRQNLEAKYRAMGYDEKHAEERAAKRIKTEKVVAAAAGLTIAAASAYVIKNRIEEKSDHIIKSGKTLQRVADSENVDFSRALYTSGKKSDNLKYRGLYGMQLQNGTAGLNNVKALNLKATKDLKVVSNEKARDTFVGLYKTNPEFKKLYDAQTKYVNQVNMLAPDARYRKVYNKLTVGMSDKVLRKNGYDSFNRQLTDNSTEDARKLNKMFYDALKSKGYDAVADLNDRKYSGFKTKSATIVFGGKGKMEVSSVKNLTSDEIMKQYVTSSAMVNTPKLVKAGAAYIGAPIVANKAVYKLRIEKYRDEHPNTELTDKEIKELLKKGGTKK